MNHRQKLGYMALGAVIMAVGITIGQFVTPNIEAQSNGVFDTIVCRELFVRNTDSDVRRVIISPDSVIIARGKKKAVELRASENRGNQVQIYNPQTGERSVGMGSTEDISAVSIWHHQDENLLSVMMFSKDDESKDDESRDDKNGLIVVNPQTRESAVNIGSDGFVNSLSISDNTDVSMNAFDFSSIKGLGNLATYYDRQAGKTKILKLED